MEWPAQSPDLNPIEKVWAYIDQQLEKKLHKSKSQLITEVQQLWDNIAISDIRKLYISFTRRCELVIRNKGSHITY
ncbi:hypothetical protein ENBRE01_2462 [Enteropsectra breve]|nr:hypothetical protein ENBRE01_2462 [Enteropsectra breve]